jgi:hypothetical protein
MLILCLKEGQLDQPFFCEILFKVWRWIIEICGHIFVTFFILNFLRYLLLVFEEFFILFDTKGAETKKIGF